MADLSSLPGIKQQIQGSIPHYCCDKDQFEDFAFALKSHFGYVWLLDIFAIDQASNPGTLEIRYLFNLVETNENFIISIDLDRKTEFKSIAHLWGNAAACEHELVELFGVNFNRTYGENYFANDNKVFPMLKQEKRKPTPRQNFLKNEVISLSHPFLQGHHQFELEEKSDLVYRCEIISGLFHLGLEKILEQQSLKQTYHIMENYFPRHGLDWAVLLSRIAEKERGVDIPDRAKAMRMVFLELSRVINHLFAFRYLCYTLSLSRYQFQCNLWIKQIQSLILNATGNEYAANFVRFGGIIRDVSQGWMSRVIADLAEVESELITFYDFARTSTSFTSNLDIHILTKSEATNRSLSGPIARSTGLNFDFRKTNPFYFYDDVEFRVPIGTSGTLMDVFSIKMEEILQSISIITQVLDNLPTGQYIYDPDLEFDSIKKVNFPLDENLYTQKVNQLYVGDDFDSCEFIEGANGLMGLSCLTKNHVIDRIKFMSNDFYLKGLFGQIMKGRDRNFLELIWTSLNTDMKMVER